jgi:hypothetical protein
MRKFKSAMFATLLTLTLSGSAFPKNGTISTTSTGTISTTAAGTISTTQVGTISTTATGTISTTAAGTISTTRAGRNVGLNKGIRERFDILDVLFRLLMIW